MRALALLALLSGCAGSQLHQEMGRLREYAAVIAEQCPHATVNEQQAARCHDLIEAYTLAWDDAQAVNQCVETAKRLPGDVARLRELLARPE